MKRGEMQKIFFRFLDRLPYFPFYRTIVLDVKVMRQIIGVGGGGGGGGMVFFGPGDGYVYKMHFLVTVLM